MGRASFRYQLIAGRRLPPPRNVSLIDAGGPPSATRANFSPLRGGPDDYSMKTKKCRSISQTLEPRVEFGTVLGVKGGFERPSADPSRSRALNRNGRHCCHNCRARVVSRRSIFGPFGRPRGLFRPSKVALTFPTANEARCAPIGPLSRPPDHYFRHQNPPYAVYVGSVSQFLCCSSSRLLVLSFSLSALTCPRRHDHRVLPPPASTVAVDGGDGRRGGRSVVL